MVGEKVSDFSVKRKDQAVTMGSKKGVKVDGKIVQFEPHILFQKLAVAAERTDNIDPETIFKHELTTIPKALAETPELLHEVQKSTLANKIWSAYIKIQFPFLMMSGLYSIEALCCTEFLGHKVLPMKVS